MDLRDSAVAMKYTTFIKRPSWLFGHCPSVVFNFISRFFFERSSQYRFCGTVPPVVCVAVEICEATTAFL